jgi:hypothetical protein
MHTSLLHKVPLLECYTLKSWSTCKMIGQSLYLFHVDKQGNKGLVNVTKDTPV